MTEFFDFGTPADLDEADGTQIHMLGVDWFSSAPGVSTGGRWYRPTNNPTNTLTMCMFNLDTQALLASKTFTAPSSGYLDVLFDTPVAVTANQHYIQAVLTNRYVFTSPGGWPFTTTSLTAPNLFNARLALNTGGSLTFPAAIHGGGANFFVSPLFTLTSVDAAGTAAGLGSGSGDAFVARIGSGSSAGLGSATADATRTAILAGTAAGLGAASASAEVVTPPGYEASTWAVGQPYGRWHVATPHGRWHAGPPGGG